MRKKFSVLILVCAVALLSTLLIPTGSALSWHQRGRVKGTFDYTFDLLMDPTLAEGKTFLFAEEFETWVGDFEGDGHAYFIVMVYDESGLMEVVLLSTLTGEVDGKQGTVVIRLIGKKPADGNWIGTWKILSGTDELANLSGHGVWWGPGFGDVSPMIYYSGTIRFAPSP